MMGDLKGDERGEPEATLFKSLNLMAVAGTAILSFLIGLIVLTYSHVELTKSVVISLVFSAVLTYLRTKV
uniref:Uncharacterized protein n=2 Tax=Geoglobus ahangari TaxID=113653 RepID=A0A7C3YFN3_9EURY